MIVTKIGIFGGTFNPIHRMHIKIALKAVEQAGLDKVIFVTAALPPHKNSTGIVSGEQSHEMVKLAIKDYPQFEASSIEIDRKGKSYTYYTLMEFKRQYHDDELFFIVGGDSLAYLHKWYRAEEFMKLCTFIVYPRDGDSGEKLERECDWLRDNYGTKCIILNAAEDNISSTEIRNVVNSGGSADDFVPDAVAEYIKQNKIYISQEEA